MYDNDDRFASGLMYVKNADALDGLLKCILDFFFNLETFFDF